MKIWTKLISILKQYMKILYCKWKFGQNYISTLKLYIMKILYCKWKFGQNYVSTLKQYLEILYANLDKIMKFYKTQITKNVIQSVYKSGQINLRNLNV